MSIFSDRKQADRERLRALGYVLKQVWVRPTEWPRIKAYIARLRRKEKK
jgi:hypothetical protein